MFANTLRFMTSRHHVSNSGSMHENLFYLCRRQNRTNFSLVLKDSDTESENGDPAFGMRWPENRQFKRCIVCRYIIKTQIRLLLKSDCS